MKKEFRKILVLGAGPVVIGQSGEYDYAGTQMLQVLREEGVSSVVVNSNPTTVMTERSFSDAVYIEPLNGETVKKIIEIEKPDGILATASGKTGLEICLEISQNGYLEAHGAVILDTQPDVIKRVRNAQTRKELLSEVGEPCLPNAVVNSETEALNFAKEVGFPVFLKAAFTPEDVSFVRCDTENAVSECFKKASEKSLVGQVALEKCVDGYKEITLCCVRDAADNCVCVCSTENMDAVGVHDGDSIVVLPAQTLSDAQNEKLRSAAQKLSKHLKIEGACMVRFAVHPKTGEYVVLDVSTQLNRVTSLISKATGYPIAAVCAKIALGYTLAEIQNGMSLAADEPKMDYCAVKVPKWSFEHFGAQSTHALGACMQATGEAFAIGASFESAFLKAIRSMNPKTEFVKLQKLQEADDAEISTLLHAQDNERIFAVYEALKRGVSLDEIQKITKIDMYYLLKLKNIADTETALRAGYTKEVYSKAKSLGFLDSVIRKLCNAEELPDKCVSSYGTVDACTAKTNAQMPYFYSVWDKQNAAAMYLDAHPCTKKKILVVGAGPTSIGLGTDRDYAAFSALRTLQDFGYETVMLNNNPAANTTDLSAADKVYIDPITDEDVANVAATEKPDGAILVFGGGEALRKSEVLTQMGVSVFGADLSVHKKLKNKIEFFDILDRLNIRHTGSRRMFIGKGFEVDVLTDGEEFLIPGIYEHIEKAEVPSGDSISVYPTVSLSEMRKDEVTEAVGKLVRELKVKGLLNIQFVLFDNALYMTSASAVATRNIPFMSKATGLPIVEIAVRLMLGETLGDIGIGTGLYNEPNRCFVRVPVFSFEALADADIQLGEEMKSTGEVMGVGDTFDEALLKGFIASGMRIKRTGGVLVTVADTDKQASVALADEFLKQDFKIYATSNTAKLLNANHVAANAVRKIHDGEPNTLTLILKNRLSYVVSTAENGAKSNGDDVRIRRTALLRRIPVLPSVETASALAQCLAKNDAVQELNVKKL